MERFDLIAIGGGSAGLKAARTAAKKGYRVAVAEEKALGGECFWAGCVPTKALIRAAQVWRSSLKTARYGLHSTVQHTDFSEAMAWKDRAMKTIGGGGSSDGGLSKLGAAYYPTRATFEGAHEVRVGGKVIYGEKIILATGTVPAVPPIPGLAEVGYITNREATSLKQLPKRLVVLGAGPIGLEFAQTFCRFGAETTVIELGERILPREDRDIALAAYTLLLQEGMTIFTGTQVVQAERDGGAKRVWVQRGAERWAISCDEILVATGRCAATEGMNIEATGLSANGYLKVDPYLRTEVPHIFAPGDVSGGYLFTHVASYEGKMAAHNAFAETPKPIDERAVPRCTYIDPEIASIGLTEEEARLTGLPIEVATFAFEDLDRAVLHGDTHGFVKLVIDERDGQILGGHILGHEASSLLGEIALAMQNYLPVSAIANTMHAYPSFPEAIEAAALSLAFSRF